MRSQISMEYIMIMAIAMLAVLGALMIFRNYALDSNDKLLDSRATDAANQILSKARSIYYYGAPSKSLITPEMPGQIDQMYIVTATNADPSKNEYYLGFTLLTSSGKRQVLIESGIPITNANNPCAPDPGISAGSASCFTPITYSSGPKNIQVLATSCVINGVTLACVDISEVSETLT